MYQVAYADLEVSPLLTVKEFRTPYIYSMVHVFRLTDVTL